VEYTKQSRLKRFGARWGCYATSIINAIEHELGRQLTLNEIATVIGRWYLFETMAICNYKDHTRLGDELGGWSQIANPEWHFFVFDQNDSLVAAMLAVGVIDLTHEYEILKLGTTYGDHFVLCIDGQTVINPDPRYSGPVKERRPLKID
jgi:hypothetical protein